MNEPAVRDPIRVGMLYSQTGVTSVIERSGWLGTLLAVEEILGPLTPIVLALHLVEAKSGREKYIARLEQRLAAQRKINQAKTILMDTRRVSEDDAYKFIRDQATSKRVATEEIADAVIKANEILGLEARTKR